MTTDERASRIDLALTDEQIEAYLALADTATPGPWTVDVHRETVTDVWRFLGSDTDGDNPVVFDCSSVDYEGGGWPPNDSDTAFIAQSRTIGPALAAELLRLRAEHAACAGALATAELMRDAWMRECQRLQDARRGRISTSGSSTDTSSAAAGEGVPDD